MFSIATSQTRSVFNGKVFHQVDGVAMGSPLASVLANLFLGHHENMWLQSYEGPSVPFCGRYVYDTLGIFNTENEAKLFFDFFNSQHPTIRFTMAKKPTSFWHFLMCA